MQSAQPSEGEQELVTRQAQQTTADAEIKSRSEIQKLCAETEKLRLESKHLEFPSPKWLQLIAALLAVFGVFSTAGAALVGVFAATFQVLINQHQAQQFHQDELFAKAIAQLGSHDSKERAAAVVAITDYASRSRDYENQALTLIAIALQSETDPSVLKVSIQALPRFGMDALKTLIQNNREAYDRMARATGRYLGIQALGQKTVKLQGQQALDDLMAGFLFKLPTISESRSWPWQEVFSSDAEFFQVPDQLYLHAGFRSAFEQTTKSKSIALTDETDARNEFEHSLRNLWVNTQAMVAVMRAVSGKVAGVNLRGTVLIHPHLAEVDLRGIDARSAIWMAPILRNTHLEFADISGAEMKYADLRKANLTGSNIAGTSFGQQDKDLETRTMVQIRFLQRDANLDGANFWELRKESYLFNQLAGQMDPGKKTELEKHRAEIRGTSTANEYLSKIPETFIDD